MDALEPQSCVLVFTSLLHSLEAKGFVAKDGDLFEEFMRSLQLATNFQCTDVDSCSFASAGKA